MPGAPNGRLGAGLRSHKTAGLALAVAGFLGLGGMLGQWGVHRLDDAVRGDAPPTGFDALHASWRDTARLNERLLAAGGAANDHLTAGTAFTGRVPPPVLRADLADLHAVRRGASDVAGRVRSTATGLPGARAQLLELVALIERAAHRVADGVLDAYRRVGGQPMSTGSGGFAPVFSNRLRADASDQDGVVRQVAAALGPTARRFGRTQPTIRGWNRLVYPGASSDTPTY